MPLSESTLSDTLSKQKTLFTLYFFISYREHIDYDISFYYDMTYSRILCFLEMVFKFQHMFVLRYDHCNSAMRCNPNKSACILGGCVS